MKTSALGFSLILLMVPLAGCAGSDTDVNVDISSEELQQMIDDNKEVLDCFDGHGTTFWAARCRQVGLGTTFWTTKWREVGPGMAFWVATWRQVRPGTAFGTPWQEKGAGMAGAGSAGPECSDGNFV